MISLCFLNEPCVNRITIHTYSMMLILKQHYSRHQTSPFSSWAGRWHPAAPDSQMMTHRCAEPPNRGIDKKGRGRSGEDY